MTTGNRKERRASGRRGAAWPPAATTAEPQPALNELFGAATAQHRGGALAEAERRYRYILTLYPDHAETHGMLAVALITQGRINEAIPHFERTAALKPDLPGVYDDLGRAYMAAAKPEMAVQAAARALELEETERRKNSFAHYAKYVAFTAENPRLRKLLLRALVEVWARPRELVHVCISLISCNAVISAAIAKARAAWPNRMPATELPGAAAMDVLAGDELLCRLLECDPITDLGLERLLTNLRLAVLTQARSGEHSDSLIGFYCAVARQCFVNEYVFSMTEAEAGSARSLRTSLDNALAANEPVPPLWPVAVGAYFPLGGLANADALIRRSWPASVEAVLVQQITEPAQERDIAATIPALTTIEDAVSRVVRDQYETNPYPRWSKAGPPGQPGILASRQAGETSDVLIAGCGTGLSTSEFARYARDAHILAIDLSVASLSYAKRMAQNLGLTNVEFAQADIMKLGSIGRQFDFIDSSGVLHHLADPWEGWRILLSLLRPGGAMEVGLYSEVARRNVVAGRELIAQRGYRPVPEDIRRCREDIAAAPDGSLLKSLTRSDDFYSTSECRDLLFHPQEHRLTLPDIKAFVTANNLQFAGFALAPAVLQRFAARFPGRAAMTDLDCWHAFETEAPDTFAGMYLLSVCKPGPANKPPANPA